MYSLQKLSVVDLNSGFCENKSISFVTAKKISGKFMIFFKLKQRTPQLIERVKY